MDTIRSIAFAGSEHKAGAGKRNCRELAVQLDQTYKDALAGGADESDATRVAEAQFRDWRALARAIEIAEPVADRTYPKIEWLAGGIQSDLRHALWVMRKSPMFTFIAVSTLALGIGGCTAIVSLLHAVVLRPIEYREPNQLVMLWESNLKLGVHDNVVAMADYLDWKARNHVFSDLSLILDQIWNMTENVEPDEVTGISVSAGFLPMLGVQPVIGRSFFESEARQGGPAVAILSHRMWVKRFHSDPAVIGQKIMLDEVPRTIIGVLPAGFPWLGNELDVADAGTVARAGLAQRRGPFPARRRAL